MMNKIPWFYLFTSSIIIKAGSHCVAQADLTVTLWRAYP